MVDITPLVPEGRQIIQGYGDGRFRISGQLHHGAVLVLPDRTMPWDAVAVPGASSDSLAAVMQTGADVEILLFGCGVETAVIDAALRRDLSDVGIAVEAMSTGAACRTFNVLVAEDRRVAAALIPVE